MGIVLFIITICIEIGFLAWNFKKKMIHQKEKVIVCSIEALILLILIIAGVLYGIGRYGMFLFVVILQALFGLIPLIKKKEKEFKRGKMLAGIFGTLFL